jgi:hypothetical protein
MIARILSALVALAFIALTFVFVSLIVAIAVAAGLLLAAWAWWRGNLKVTRSVRGEVKVNVRRGRARGEVVEGQYRVIDQK